MVKKIIYFLLALILLFTSFIPSFADLQSENENKATTGYRMEPLLKKYNSLGQLEIQDQINKYVDIRNHFGKDYIARLASLNIIVGDGVSKFNPNDTLLACQYLKMVVMALGFTPDSIPGTYWWQPYINIALEEKLINQNEIKDYTAPLSRELAGTIGFRALMKYKVRPTGENEWFNYNKSKIFDYAYISDEYKNDVVMAYRMGILLGNNNIYEPKGTLTRAQGAIIVNKLIDDNIRVESVPKSEEILVYKIRTDLNEALFSYRIKAGQEYKIYPGDFALNEIYDVFKAMLNNIHVGSGHKEIAYGSTKNNIVVEQYNLKEDADYVFNIDNRLPKFHSMFAIDNEKCFEKDILFNYGSGYLYKLIAFDNLKYNEQMKSYTYKIFEVLFESEYKKAVEIHDYYLNLCLQNKKREAKSYYINGRQVIIQGGGGSNLEIAIWAKGTVKENNLFQPYNP